jgi:amino acid adenylation domain-containing protein/thioester reductase-like protein
MSLPPKNPGSSTVGPPARGDCFLDRFRAVVAAHSEAPAVLHMGRSALTYRELFDRAARLGSCLRAAGVGPGAVVGIGVDRSPEFVTALLGIWWSGAAFLPLDGRWPDDRLAFVVRDAGLACAVASEERVAPLGRLGVRSISPLTGNAATAASLPCHRAAPHELAYVIYTSGSTGQPKGVLVEHRGIVNLIDAQIPAFDLGPGRRALWMLSPCFDASVSDLATALLTGATLVIEAEEDLRDPARLTRLLHGRAITNVDLPPALLRFLDPDALPSTLRTVIIGGEPAPPALVRQWARRFRVVNVYGPTEATVCTSLCLCDPDTWSEPLLGRPIAGIGYHFLGDDLEPVATGAVGELFITGVGLARGYLNRPELTAAKFPELNGERAYRTGDRVRLRADGELVFVGRTDRQIKLRGQLVEPQEIEARLLEHPGVGQAAVLKRKLSPGENSGREILVAFIVPDSSGVVLSPAMLRGHLANLVPAWMIPQHFEVVDDFPRTTSGKVETAALETRPIAPTASDARPLSSLEKTLASVWGRVLGADHASPDASFFDQGGDSLGILEAVAAGHAEGLIVPPALLAEGRTIAEVAEWLSRQDWSTEPGGIDASELEADVTDLLRELQPPARPARPFTETPAVCLLTGGTGFLGSRLLCELLRRTAAEVVCLVRSPSPAAAAARLHELRESQGVDLPPGSSERVRAVCGDLGRNRFGLSPGDWENLAGRVDTVYHCGARVNIVLPYTRLRQDNVLATREVLRFLSGGRGKRLHYASTLSVFVGTDRNHGRLREGDDLLETKTVYGGYAQSKWAAERLLRKSCGAFGPVAYYRLGLITGDTTSGRTSGSDLLTLFLRGIARIGGLPKLADGGLTFDVTPVDYAAAAFAQLSLNTRSVGDGTTYHVANRRGLSLGDVERGLRDFGIPLARLTDAEWLHRLRSLGRDSADAAAACMALCRGLPGGSDVFDHYRTTDLFQATGVEFDTQNTTAGLAGSGIVCPPADSRLLRIYIQAAFPDGSNFC